jgi:outer membrane lipoprotein-sorting protein
MRVSNFVVFILCLSLLVQVVTACSIKQAVQQREHIAQALTELNNTLKGGERYNGY